MAVRPSMAALIAEAREMIDDTADTPNFPDQRIQDLLDGCRWDVNAQIMTPRREIVEGGVVVYNQYSFNLTPTVPIGAWEDSVVIRDSSYEIVTPLTSDLISGWWTFDNHLPPLFLTGRSYDLHRAAADLLTRWLPKLRLRAVTFTADGAKYNMRERMDNTMALIKLYRQRQRLARIPWDRTDTSGGASDQAYPFSHLR